MIQRPETNECNPYYERYIKLVPDGDLLEILKRQETQDVLQNISQEQSEFRYEPGKWSLKEVLGHIADTERVMSYRLLAISRGDNIVFPPFDQDDYVAIAQFDRLSLQDILANCAAVRQSTCSLLSSLSDDALTRKGTVMNHQTTARALAYIIIGHELHHLQIIKERYLK